MKKQIVILGIAVVLIAVGLSGCEEERSSGTLDSRFVGTWENPIGVEVAFASNGSYYTSTVGWHGTWEVKNGKICYTYEGESTCLEFSFSEDGNTLTTRLVTGTDIAYTKK